MLPAIPSALPLSHRKKKKKASSAACAGFFQISVGFLPFNHRWVLLLSLKLHTITFRTNPHAPPAEGLEIMVLCHR